jgi:hypothetical protein
MDESKYIEFQKTRDFSSKMSATIDFIKQNFKPFYKAILFLAGPPIIVLCLVIGTIFDKFMTLAISSSSAPGGDDAFLNFFSSFSLWANLILIVILATLSMVMITATINNYVIIYREKRSNKIEVEEVWNRVKKTFWGYFFAFIGYFFLIMVVYLGVLLFAGVVGLISSGLAGLLTLVMMCGFVYVLVAASLLYAVQGFESTGFFKGISRSFYLIRGKWWSTFGLLMVTTIIIYTISLVFIIPMYITVVVTALHSVENREANPFDSSMSWFMIVSIGLYYLCYFLLTSIPQLALVFQYFNLVEMKESKGLIEKMESLGTTDQSLDPVKEDY